MKVLVTLFLFISFLGNCQTSDPIYPPSEGKSVIYFVRSTGLGALMNIRYFDNGNYIGKFNGKNFIRYECEPGKRIFWIKAENVDFVEAELEANKIYIVETNATMGAFSAAARFLLVDFKDEKQMKRILKVLKEKEGVTFTTEELKEDQLKMKDAISFGMKTVVDKRKRKKKIKYLKPDMNYTK